MASTSQTESVSPTTDDVFELLGHRHRRCLLTTLRERDEPVPVRIVAAEIAVLDDSRSPDNVSTAEIDQVRTRLYHVHVPKLEAYDVVSRADADSENALALDENASHLEPHLDIVRGSNDA